MNKLTILSTIIAATFIMSCNKEATFSRTAPPAPEPPPPPTVKIASSWFSPSFTLVNDRSSIYRVAQKDHETTVTYDGGTHVELASDMQVRYIVISSALFNSLHIN